MNDHMRAYPAYVGWDVVSACNHNCFYCYNYWRTDKMASPSRCSGGLSSIADFIISKKPVIVIISGGEPLLIFDEIKNYIVTFYEHGIFVRIQTNGSLITEEIAAFCKKYEVRLMVSFPCLDKGIFQNTTGSENTYEAVIQGMDRLMDYNVKFYPNVVVSKLNLNYIHDTIEYLVKKYSLEKIFVSRVTRPSNASDLFSKYELSQKERNTFFYICEELQRKYKIEITGCGGFPLCVFPSQKSLEMFGKVCGAGENGYTIDTNGDVRACSRDGNSLGNIFADDFDILVQRLHSWGKREILPPKCSSCHVAEVCNGGCRMTVEDNIRSGKSVDCDADPDNAPRKLPRRTGKIFPILKRYSVQKPLRVVEHEGIYRLSYYYRVIYLCKSEANFVSENSNISIFHAMRKLKISYGKAKKLISNLYFSEIIK